MKSFLVRAKREGKHLSTRTGGLSDALPGISTLCLPGAILWQYLRVASYCGAVGSSVQRLWHHTGLKECAGNKV